MKLCRVLGNVYGEAKHSDFRGRKLMIVQPLNPRLEPKGASYLAVDSASAGVGDTVLVMSEGSGVRQILRADRLCIRSVIVGIVDEVDYHPDPA